MRSFGDRFWTSAEGEMIRFRRRRFESLRVDLPLDPPTKNSRRGTKKKAKAALDAAFEDDILARHARELTPWPKPRAAIALDIYLAGGSRNSPRVDNICKWLLDELAGHVYADDRQVKLLFASASKPPRASWRFFANEDLGDLDDVSKEVYRDRTSVADEPTSTAKKPSSKLYITAQTRASVLADLRAVSNLEDRWDPFEEEGRGYFDVFEDDLRRDSITDYRSIFDSGSDRDREQWRRLTNELDHHDQNQQQHLVDLIFSSLLTDMPVDRFELWNRVLGRIGAAPYIFNLGVLPKHGGRDAFKANLRQTLEARRDAWPSLFPMRARSGVSMILFEEPSSGKDLDNLVQTVLPDVLTVLRPQEEDLRGWVADEPDPHDGEPTIPFIEVAAIPAHLTDMPAGSVIFGLSSADRYDSWWHKAAEHLKETLEEEELRGWW
ncbi:hypothetical protein ACIPY5_14960 [Microbacterium sp. NPDC089698]|uniref:hypothetical protein n=1 Tax=Microbacterium sp. NPDC089698 TaxID=3364200 RepID=UPI00380D4F89